MSARNALLGLIVTSVTILALAGCGEGFVFELPSATATIGAAGGTLALPGGISLEIPPNALAAPTSITLRHLTPSERHPALVGATLDLSVALEPDGLLLAVPAILRVTLPATEGGPSVSATVPWVAVEEGGELEGPEAVESEIDEISARSIAISLARMRRAHARFSHPSQPSLSLNWPGSIPTGDSDVMEFTITAGFSSINSVQDARWRTESEDITTEIESGVSLPYPALGVLNGGFIGSHTEEVEVTCPPGVTDGATELTFFMLELEFEPMGLPAVFIPTFRQILPTENIVCIGGTGGPPGTSINDPMIISTGLPLFLEAMLSLGGVPAPFEGVSCIPDATPRVIVAGADPTGQMPTAVIVNAATGIVEQTFVMPITGTNTAFDAHLILPAAGTTGLEGGIVTNGTIGVFRSVDANCTASGTQIQATFRPDTSYVVGDPTRGVVSATFTGLELQQILDGTGVTRTPIPLSGGVRTAVANAGADTFVTVMGPTQMTLVSWDGTTATETPIANFGTNLRRARWDPQSGLMAISDLTEDNLYCFTWDGMNAPVFIGTAAVGAGPVGLDVLDHRIVCAGFDDDTYSIVEVDLAQMQISSVSTQAHPFTSGTQPGHAVFMRDSNNSIGISFFGDSRVAFIPFAF